MPTSTLVFYVNGKEIADENVDPEWTLLHYLRNKLRLCGTKLGCAEGGCGACTVMVSQIDRKKNSIIHYAVNACLTPVCAMHGLAVTTVEGIGSTKTKLHPVQERIAKAHGSQCGFCTPGIVMSMYALLRTRKKINMDDLQVAFQGNLCRCTGYRAIIEGFKSFTEDWEREQIHVSATPCSAGVNCCKNQPNNSYPSDCEDQKVLFSHKEYTPLDATQEAIFPPKLQLFSTLDDQSLQFKGSRVIWFRPTDLLTLLNLKEVYPEARIVVGNTEIGVETKFKKCIYPVLIHPRQISELLSTSKTDKGLKIGSCITLSELELELLNHINEEPGYKTKVFRAILDMLHYFAGKQIRNTASLGGNIMTGSPISDLIPILMAACCQLHVMSKSHGLRILNLDHTFFLDYRKNIVQPDEVLISVIIPYTTENQYFYAYKQARRRDDDIAIVNCAVNVILSPLTSMIEDMRIAFGGMSKTTVLARKTQQKLIGKKWNNDLLEDAYDSLIEELSLPPDAPGGMIRYRRSLVLSFFFKTYLSVSQELNNLEPKLQTCNIPTAYQSACLNFRSLPFSSAQYFQEVSANQNEYDQVGRPIVHKSAFKQATGEAVYCDDMPHVEGELYLALVYSTKPHARIVSVDATNALSLKGVHSFFSEKDLPGERNLWGPVFHDDEVFARNVVTCQGQVIGAIVADDQTIAQQAAKLVNIVYEDITPVILTIEDTVKNQSFFPGYPKYLRKGDVNKAFEIADHIITGEARMAGQEHFYLETQCCFAVPKLEDDEMTVYLSSQNPTEAQKLIANMLGVPANRIMCHVKRMGGGFGGKESRFNIVSLPVALAAHCLQRPVRCMLDRDEDMILTGQRHPFYAKYKVAFTKEGKIIGIDVHIYNNAGNSMDLSASVLERAMFHIDNSYCIPNVQIAGYVCRSNLPSNTAFRGFGGPQGMFFAENIIRDIACFLTMDPEMISEKNMYKEGDLTHYNQPLLNCTLTRCWRECLEKSQFKTRQQEIVKYNRQNRWKKKGISQVPTKFGIAFTAKFLNQAGALIHVYTDGSVLLTHGGTEMGQGIHTKMIQIASRTLELPDSYIHISDTSTDKVPNTSPTAASAGSDLNGMAVLNACQTILERLKPFKEANPKGIWEDWVKAAYFARVSLSAAGFYKTPNIGYNWDQNKGNPFNYFTYGAACSEVEIDCLTGDHQVLRTDVVMDIGDSLNPAIDIGQIEGAFAQGYGLFTIEEPLINSQGALLTRGPGTYKLPGFSDIPAIFNVSLLKGASNPRAVYSSKAVGEPPLFLASSIFFAIKEAITSARIEQGLSANFHMNAPATAEHIRLSCEDHLVQKIPEPTTSYIPWSLVA